MKNILFMLLASALIGVAGCSSSRVTDTWSTTEQPNINFNKILVVGLFDEKNKGLRNVMEKEVVEELRKKGFNAVSSYREFGPSSFRNANSDAVINKVVSNKFDGVITIDLVDKENQKRYIQEPGYYTPGGWAYNPFRGWRYRPFGYYNYGNGHYENNTNYYFETNLYDVDAQKLVYSVQTKSYDPSSAQSMANDYSKSIVKSLQKSSIIN